MSGDGNRRDFLYVATAGAGAVAAGAAVWPVVDQMNPSKDVLALASIEVPVGELELLQVDPQVPGAVDREATLSAVTVRHQTSNVDREATRSAITVRTGNRVRIHYTLVSYCVRSYTLNMS